MSSTGHHNQVRRGRDPTNAPDPRVVKSEKFAALSAKFFNIKVSSCWRDEVVDTDAVLKAINKLNCFAPQNDSDELGIDIEPSTLTLLVTKISQMLSRFSADEHAPLQAAAALLLKMVMPLVTEEHMDFDTVNSLAQQLVTDTVPSSSSSAVQTLLASQNEFVCIVGLKVCAQLNRLAAAAFPSVVGIIRSCLNPLDPQIARVVRCGDSAGVLPVLEAAAAAAAEICCSSDILSTAAPLVALLPHLLAHPLQEVQRAALWSVTRLCPDDGSNPVGLKMLLLDTKLDNSSSSSSSVFDLVLRHLHTSGRSDFLEPILFIFNHIAELDADTAKELLLDSGALATVRRVYRSATGSDREELWDAGARKSLFSFLGMTTNEHEVLRAAVIDERFLPVIIDGLADEEICDNAARCIGALMDTTNLERKLQIVGAGAVEALLRALKTHDEAVLDFENPYIELSPGQFMMWALQKLLAAGDDEAQRTGSDLNPVLERFCAAGGVGVLDELRSDVDAAAEIWDAYGLGESDGADEECEEEYEEEEEEEEEEEYDDGEDGAQ